MSVQKRPNGTWQVRYRAGGRQLSRNFARKGDADRFDADRKRRGQLGPRLAAEIDNERSRH